MQAIRRWTEDPTYPAPQADSRSGLCKPHAWTCCWTCLLCPLTSSCSTHWNNNGHFTHASLVVKEDDSSSSTGIRWPKKAWMPSGARGGTRVGCTRQITWAIGQRGTRRGGGGSSGCPLPLSVGYIVLRGESSHESGARLGAQPALPRRQNQHSQAHTQPFTTRPGPDIHCPDSPSWVAWIWTTGL